MEQWKKNLAVLWIGQFLVMGGMTMIIPFMSLYLQFERIGSDRISMKSQRWAGIIFAGNFVTAFIFQPLWGKLSDHYGRKMMLLRSGIRHGDRHGADGLRHIAVAFAAAADGERHDLRL